MSLDVSESLPDGKASLSEGRTSLSLEAFSGPPETNITSELEGTVIAQAGKDETAAAERTTEDADYSSEFTTLPKDGKLGFIVSAGENGVATYAKGMTEVDNAWMVPYNELTEFDGHRLLDTYKNASFAIDFELDAMSDEEFNAIEPTINKFETPNEEITAEMLQAVEKYPQLKEALVAYHGANSDPNLERAFDLKFMVETNLDESINMRERVKDFVSQDENQHIILPNGMNMYAAFLAFDFEKRTMQRYQRSW